MARRPAALALDVVVACSLFIARSTDAQQVEVANTAKYEGGGRYNWTVYLDAPRSVLNSIDSVTYLLHPTFPEPIRKVTNPTDRFSLSSNGWGEFNVHATIVYKDGRVEQQDHWLTFRPAKPGTTKLSTKARASAGAFAVQAAPPPPPQDAVEIANTSVRRADDLWEWTIFVRGEPKTLERIQCVRYVLHPTFPNPINDVCNQGDNAAMAFPLHATGWGTFTVGVRITFRDGEVRQQQHELVFGK